MSRSISSKNLMSPTKSNSERIGVYLWNFEANLLNCPVLIVHWNIAECQANGTSWSCRREVTPFDFSVRSTAPLPFEGTRYNRSIEVECMIKVPFKARDIDCSSTQGGKSSSVKKLLSTKLLCAMKLVTCPNPGLNAHRWEAQGQGFATVCYQVWNGQRWGMLGWRDRFGFAAPTFSLFNWWRELILPRTQQSSACISFSVL